MSPPREARPVRLARSGVALGLMLAGTVLFLMPVAMAVVAAFTTQRVVVWTVGAAVMVSVAARIALLGAHVGADGLMVRNPLRTRHLSWESVAGVRWQCLKAGALDHLLPPNCRLLVEIRGGNRLAVHATVYLTGEQRDAVERLVRRLAPTTVRAFTRQSSAEAEPGGSPS
ncbi:MAG: PH domain-containing protein [Actinobacteria bacterium]|nr:PH domain-containing protein [Actinomycetota bacterium]